MPWMTEYLHQLTERQLSFRNCWSNCWSIVWTLKKLKSTWHQARRSFKSCKLHAEALVDQRCLFSTSYMIQLSLGLYKVTSTFWTSSVCQRILELFYIFDVWQDFFVILPRGNTFFMKSCRPIWSATMLKWGLCVKITFISMAGPKVFQKISFKLQFCIDFPNPYPPHLSTFFSPLCSF